MVRATVLALLTIAAAGPMVPTVDAQTMEAVAIVVHPEVAIDDDNLTLNQLRSIFLAERQHWGDRSRITLLVRAAIAPERDLILTEIYGMSEDRYRQYWIGKMEEAQTSVQSPAHDSQMGGGSFPNPVIICSGAKRSRPSS
jgi:ABC-type phosphate transport system substrate-binding protein